MPDPALFDLQPQVLLVGLIAFIVFQLLRLVVLKRLGEADPGVQLGILGACCILVAYGLSFLGLAVPAMAAFAAAVVVHRLWKAVPVSQ